MGAHRGPVAASGLFLVPGRVREAVLCGGESDNKREAIVYVVRYCCTVLIIVKSKGEVLRC